MAPILIRNDVVEVGLGSFMSSLEPYVQAV